MEQMNIMKMDMDSDSDDEISNHSSDSNSSSSSSSTSSSDDSDSGHNEPVESMELAKIAKTCIQLPRGLCDNEAIFHEFFSMRTWNCLPEPVKQHLKVNFLPKFPHNDEINKELAIQKLFNREEFRFEKSPLVEFQRNLEEGNYRPEIVRLRSSIRKSQRREQKFLECERVSRIAKAVMLSREKLLRAAYDSPPGTVLKVERTQQQIPKFSSSPAAARAKKRYFQELTNIVEEVGIEGQQSDDENYPEGPPAQLSRKQKRHLSGLQGGAQSPGAETRVFSTLAHRGGTLDHLVGPGGTSPLSEEFYRQMLYTYKKRKLEEPEHPDLDITNIKLNDISMRTQLSAGHRRPISHAKLLNGSSPSSMKETSSRKLANLSSKLMKQEQNLYQSQYHQQLIRSQSLLMVGQNNQQQLQHTQIHPPPPQLQHQQPPPPPPQPVQPYSTNNISNLSNNTLNSLSDDSDDELMMNRPIKLEPKQSPPELVSIMATKIPTLPPQTSLTPILNTTNNNNSISNNNSNSSSNNISPMVTHIKQENLLASANKKMATTTTVVSGGGGGGGTGGGITLSTEQPNSSQNFINTTLTAVSPAPMQSSLIINQNERPNMINIANYSGKVKPATFSDLEGIDMMRIPVDLDESGNIDILSDMESTPPPALVPTSGSIMSSASSDKTPELMQETHACFLSLVRDIFCSTPDHRTTLENLKKKVFNWLGNPITPLNDWYGASDNWLNLVPSAINFLSGEFTDQPEEFVPYIEYKMNLHIYQWIGAGRDTDQHLIPLCIYWLSRKHEMTAKPIKMINYTENMKAGNSQKSNIQVKLEVDDDYFPERPCSPPPPRYPTNWTVSKAQSHEIEDFRIQERARFEYPHLAFVYRMHGYESVVGPVKGIYTHQVHGMSKARGHNMLVAHRPNFVTILTLVRDATARLPNGEGTRTDICELLKSSQYINPLAPDAVLQTIVSGALDRMHTEHDPCVRYDPKRKIWIYLHRNRTKEEFERLHQQFQGMGKHKKTIARKFKTKKHISSPPPSTKTTQVKTAATNSVIPSNVIVVQSTPIEPQTSSSPLPAIAAPIPSQPPLQMPALSSISSPLTAISSPTTTNQQQPIQSISMGSQPPPLLNKISTLNTHKSIPKPELVPIKMLASPIMDKTMPELIDVEASLDAQNAPMLINITSQGPNPSQLPSSPTPQTMPGLVQSQKPTKMITTTATKNLSTPIKISTSSGIQTVHVSSSQSPSMQGNKPLTSILANPNSQSILLNNRSHSPIVVSGGNTVVTNITGNVVNTTTTISNKKLGKQILISQNQAPPLISHSVAPNMMPGQSYIIPINIASQNTAVSPKLIKTSANSNPPALTSTIAPKSILQQNQANNFTNSVAMQQKTSIIRNNQTSSGTMQPGKSLINPAVVQQRNTVISTVPNTIQKQAQQIHQQQQQQLQQIQIRPNVSIAKTTINPTTLTPAQQKQLLQNIIVQQTKQIQQQQHQQQTPQGTAATLISTSPSGAQTIKSIIIAPPQQQNQSSGMTTPTQSSPIKTITTTATSSAQSGLMSPQIIQIQSNNSQQKIQTLTPQQQQSLLATLKQHQLKNNQQRNITQQSLIIKQQPTLIQNQQQQQQQQQQHQQQQLQQTKVALSGTPTSTTSIIKSGQSLLGQNFIVTSSTGNTIVNSTSATKIISSPQPLVTHILKSGTSIIQQTGAGGVQQNQQNRGKGVATTNQVGTTKVLTNQAGQIISLESLFQKSQLAPGTTLRVAGSKPGQTSLIQLASAPGSQVTQYAVVSQGRNIIPIQNAQRIITSSMGQQSQSIPGTTMSSIIKTDTKTTQSQASLMATTAQVNQQQNKIIQQVQTMGGAATKLKSGIRMVNATNLNLAQFGGKPVIIASKTPGSGVGQLQGQNVILQSTGQNTANGTNFVIQGGQAIKLPGNILSPQTQTVMLNNQLVKVQTQQSMMANSNIGATVTTGTTTTNMVQNTAAQSNQKTMVLGTTATGQTITKLQTNQGSINVVQQQNQQQINQQQQQQQQVVLGTALKNAVKTAGNSNQRLVFAVQGSGGPIFLQQGFQTGSINLKGLKVIPIQQNQQQNKGEDRQVYAQILTSPQTRTPSQGNNSSNNGGSNATTSNNTNE